jgi:hypothetical protein
MLYAAFTVYLTLDMNEHKSKTQFTQLLDEYLQH